MSEIQDYKCPSCGGKVVFDTQSQKLKCPFCGNLYDVNFFDQDAYEEKPEGITDNLVWEDAASNLMDDEVAVYQCTQCGGEIIADATTGATKCPFCDSPVVIIDKFKGELKPDYVIPFKFGKNAAKKALQDFYKDKKLLPKSFSKETTLKEIKSVYVPFWLYDAKVNADATFSGTQSFSHIEGDYEVTETKHYDLYRAGKMEYNAIPVDGSTKFVDEMMESIEPFNMNEAVPFNSSYLSGYSADRYDVPVEESIDRANERLRQSVKDTLYSQIVGYSNVVCNHCNIDLLKGSSHYALYPVWFLTAVWKDKKYFFVINGQTGKIAGDLPMSWSQFFKYLFCTFAIVAIVTFVWLALVLKYA